MIKFSNTDVRGWEAAIRGVHSSMDSPEKGDSKYEYFIDECGSLDDGVYRFVIGPNDFNLLKKLRNTEQDPRKFIDVYVDILAPMYWWNELDTYRSLSFTTTAPPIMYRLASKEFSLEDFSYDHLIQHSEYFSEESPDYMDDNVLECYLDGTGTLEATIRMLNYYRDSYLKTYDMKYRWQIVQLLPASYNQYRTVHISYEDLSFLYDSCKNRLLDEWSVGFIDWIFSLPYSELITGIPTE